MTSRPFGRLPDGRLVSEYVLQDTTGLRASILDYGGIITKLEVPDRDGALADVVLGFDDLEGYARPHPYFGAIVGRYANRIAGGRCRVDSRELHLANNEGANHLHGGDVGFDRAVWGASYSESPARLVLTHTSPDGDEGYPGTLSVVVIYTVAEGALRVDYAATTDATTILNLTQHTYFHLGGHDSGDVLGHELRVRSDSILELDEESIPTGRFLDVTGTPLDFREGKPIGQDIAADHSQLALAGGYDHNWVLGGGDVVHALDLFEPVSGRRLEVLTDQPGVQVYTSNNLDGSIIGKGGFAYGQHAAVALETQHFPDSPNHPEFPSTVLEPGDEFRSQTIFRFRHD